jgi:hypothetical protein
MVNIYRAAWCHIPDDSNISKSPPEKLTQLQPPPPPQQQQQLQHQQTRMWLPSRKFTCHNSVRTSFPHASYPFYDYHYNDSRIS